MAGRDPLRMFNSVHYILFSSYFPVFSFKAHFVCFGADNGSMVSGQFRRSIEATLRAHLCFFHSHFLCIACQSHGDKLEIFQKFYSHMDVAYGFNRMRPSEERNDELLGGFVNVGCGKWNRSKYAGIPVANRYFAFNFRLHFLLDKHLQNLKINRPIMCSCSFVCFLLIY